MKFINRKKDIEFLKTYLKTEPNCLLFIYGPKSSGKSSLLNKVIQELEYEEYAVNFLDLRQVIIYNFKSFLNVFFPKRLRNKVKDILKGITINSGFFSVSVEEESFLQENAFGLMVDKLISANKRGIKPVIIIDEIQLLKNIWMNGERYLIDELFNLFIALTKVRHLSHVILATSDSYFIEEIYKSAKLAKTSKFFLLEHFGKEDVYNWLEQENFKDQEIEMIWNYLGGCPWEIRQIIEEKKQGISTEHSCESLLKDAYGRVFEFSRSLDKEEKKLFNKINEQITARASYEISMDDDKALDIILKKAIESDIWFYSAHDRKITANSRSIFHALFKSPPKIL